MPTNYSEASFAPVLPKMRSLELIESDISALTGKSTDEITRQQVLKIEQAVKHADLLFRQRSYSAALDKYKEARAKIYKLLYPGFDISKYLVSSVFILPQNPDLYKSLIETSSRISNMMIPVKPGIEFSTGVVPQPIENNLSEYMKTGLRGNKDLDHIVQEAAINGVGLMKNKNYQAAIDVMEPALNEAYKASEEIDANLKAALELNLSNAYYLVDNTTMSDKYSSMAIKNFSMAKDEIGVAQSFYISGLSAKKKGDVNGSSKLLSQAAELLKKKNENGHPIAVPVLSGTEVKPSSHPVSSTVLLGKRLADLKFKIDDITDSSLDIEDLKDIRDMKTNKITFRIPGRGYGWGTLPVDSPPATETINKAWRIGITSGDQVFTYKIGGATSVLSSQIQANIYEARKSAANYVALKWNLSDVVSTSVYLALMYGYTLAVKIGDCYAELGQYAKAEEYYLQASNYSYLNKNIEGVQLWIKLARNLLNWANSLYKNEAFAKAKLKYQMIIGSGAAIPASYLYTSDGLAIASAQARNLIEHISSRPLPVINLEISELILTANSFLLQLEGNLDYYGLLLSPIHTFEYLQSVARAQAQQAVQAEREFITFKGQEENEAATRRELETTLAMAQAETAARLELWKAAKDDEAAAQSAVALATKRRNDAITQRNEYASASMSQVWGQAASMALSGGEDAYWSEIKELVDRLNRGETISGAGPKLAAAIALRGGLKTREYELQRMQDTIDELAAAITVAQNQLNASKGRTAAAEIAYQASIQRQAMAGEAIDAFDDEFFTPDAWSKMADVMREISRNFLFRAIRIAKLMERAYNFDNDSSLSVIKNEYGFAVANSSNVANATLLGGDSLLDDIESFTYSAIANKTRKSSRIKDIISIASNFPAQFEEFKRTGLLSFETDLYEFDRLHPGFYEQRIEVIEIEIVGVIPDAGLNGTFKAGGVTKFRRKNNTQGQRVHQIDTSALSDFVMRNDMLLYSSETGVRGLFQGFGLGSTFQLHLPKRSNDFDFRRIFDINLIIYYTAKFDELLKTTVLSLPVRPGEMAQLSNFSMRYDFPDAWYSFYKNGKVDFQLERSRLPFNQQDFKTKTVSFRLSTNKNISNAGVEIKITAPNGASGVAVTDTNGVITSADVSLNNLNTIDPLGNWSVEILNGASLLDNGQLKFDRVYNIQIGLEYDFEYVPETL